MVVTDTGSSGFGSITGGTSTGLALTANAGAQASTDPSLLITSGGGIAVNAGSSSTATISGSTVSVTGDSNNGQQIQQPHWTFFQTGYTESTALHQVAHSHRTQVQAMFCMQYQQAI